MMIQEFKASQQRAWDLDSQDELSRFRDRFVIADPDQCYLDGNSLGRLPRSTIALLERVVQEEWGGDLVTGWESWVDLATRVGDLLGETVLGARPGQTLVTDTTSVNFYRLAEAALNDRPGRRTIIIDEANFPTDRYILQGIAAQRGYRLITIPNEDPTICQFERITPDVLAPYLSEDVALVSLQVVNYRSGARQDVPVLTEQVHAHGAHMLWDASHAVGALDLKFEDWGVHLAVGCTYKYLNSGPGAPAWLFIASALQDRVTPPIDGWFSQRDQFAMGPTFERAAGMRGFQIASPSILGLSCVQASLEIIREAGMAALEAKCGEGTDYMVDLVDEWLVPLGFDLQTPRDRRLRGGHLSLTHPDAAQIAVAMRVLCNVIPDFRRPQAIRVAMSPLYNSHTEVRTGLERVRDLVTSGTYRRVDSAGRRVT